LKRVLKTERVINWKKTSNDLLNGNEIELKSCLDGFKVYKKVLKSHGSFEASRKVIKASR
jgi:hypothetical protein